MIEKQPFRSYALDEDKPEEKSEVLTIRINKEERALIESLKELMNFTQDAKVFKASLILTKNVIHGTFSAEFFRYLTSSSRRKPIIEEQQPPNNSLKL